METGLQLADYDLRAHPFEASPDLDFLWLGQPHREALATLRAAVLHNVDLLVFTGDAGTGKTILTNALIDDLGRDKTLIGKVADPHPEPHDFFRGVADAYHFPTGFSLREAFLAHFAAFLRDAHSKQKRVLLVVDEAQSLPRQLFREIEQLVTIGKRLRDAGMNVLSVLLVGRPNLNSVLREPDNANLLRRPNIRCSIGPLTTEQVGDYIRWRLKAAGTERRLFTAGAVLQTWAAAGGVPRRINAVCGHALLEAYRQGAPMVAAEIVKACVGEAPRSSERNGHLNRRRDILHARRRVKRRIARRGLHLVVSVIGLGAGFGLALILAGHFLARVRPDEYRNSSLEEPVNALTAVNASAEPVRSPAVGVRGSAEPAELGEPTPARPRIPAAAADSIPAVAADDRMTRSPTRGGKMSVLSTDQPQKPAPRGEAGSTAASGGAAEERDLPDPAAIIDWLLKDYSRSP